MKSLGIARLTDAGLALSVHPTLVPQRHVLASVPHAFNAIYVEGDPVGPLLLYGRGAGSGPTLGEGRGGASVPAALRPARARRGRARVRAGISVRPFGVDRYLVPREADRFFLHLPEQKGFRLGVKDFAAGDGLDGASRTASISAKSKEPDCRLRHRSRKAWTLVSVSGAAGGAVHAAGARRLRHPDVMGRPERTSLDLGRGARYGW